MLDFTAQNTTQTDTPVSILPKPQQIKQSYDNFVENLPEPVDNSNSSLTPEGIMPDNQAHQPVDNLGITPKSMQDGGKSMQDDPFAGYDLSSYNTANPQYFKTLHQIYDAIPDFKDPGAVDNYLKTKFPQSHMTAKMFLDATGSVKVDPRLLASIAQFESHFGTSPRAMKFNNATGYGALDKGSTRAYKDFQDNLNHTAGNLARRKN